MTCHKHSELDVRICTWDIFINTTLGLHGDRFSEPFEENKRRISIECGGGLTEWGQVNGGFCEIPLILHSLHDLFSFLEPTKSNEVICRKVREIHGQWNSSEQFSQNKGRGRE